MEFAIRILVTERERTASSNFTGHVFGRYELDQACQNEGPPRAIWVTFVLS